MLGFKELELSDKDILNKFFDVCQNQNSECTFTNLFMWRRCYAVRWAVSDNHLLVEPNAFEESWILPPYGLEEDDDEMFHAAIEHAKEDYHDRGKQLVIRAVTEKDKERLERLFPGQFEFEEEPDIEDYIYDAEKMRTLKGRKLSKKRNHINAFKAEHPDYELVPLTPDNTDIAWDFVEHWCGQRNCEEGVSDSLLCEREAILDALTNMQELRFKGLMISVDGRIVALTFGEMVNHDTVVVHVEKAFSNYRGLYPLINQEFLNYYWQDAVYVNREEDMGLEGLRHAKRSYYPEYLLTKYKGVFKDGYTDHTIGH
ncbi:MAG: phosphatidylglycerol lysyltransferase domain-containing protein [Peptococcaceae bacterium]|nr:phosphatidylglycerol lysyltransferase domain-containing protein [Peptococcaceae bacterium]